VLLFTSSELEYHVKKFGVSNATSAIIACAEGGVAHTSCACSLFNNGFCTFVKTVEVTRHRTSGPQKTVLPTSHNSLGMEMSAPVTAPHRSDQNN
jgi:hypothetical protein